LEQEREERRKPRLLMVGRNRYRLPLDESLRRKFDALGDEFELRVIGSAAPGSAAENGIFRLVPPFRARALDGVHFFATLPFLLAAQLRSFRPDAIVAQSPREAAAALVARRVAGTRTPVLVDVHGDWRTATRLYGSPARRVLSPVADRAMARTVRGADAVRTISDYTSGLVRELGVEPALVFPAFMDLDAFLGPVEPLPQQPSVLFVGVLEHYKGIHELAAAWRLVARRVPDARLRIVGRGAQRRVVERLVQDLPASAEWTAHLPGPDVAAALDAATALALPSRSEGLGRVVVEALCRGRAVVATRVGGITDLVEDGVNGVLVPPRDPAALADALVRVLGDPALAHSLGAAGRASVEPWLATPEEYAARVRALVRSVSA
jgi:glycosyltransferase involved in cell wall biosynthesis